MVIAVDGSNIGGDVIFSSRFKAMGSPCEIAFYGEKVVAQHIVRVLRERLQKIEEAYSRYQPSSLVSRLNSSAGTGEWTLLDEEAMRLFTYADVLFSQSNGRFDVTSGVLRKAWNFRERTIPTQAEIEVLLPLIGWNKVERYENHARLPIAGMEIDFGGFVKEYAADQLMQLLQGFGVTAGLINLGGDVRVIGPRPDGSPWHVGIQHPFEVGVAIATIPLNTGAVATSGVYERCLIVDGQRYSHLLDPSTGWPCDADVLSVSIVSDQCVLAGSFSTIALLQGKECRDWLAASGADYLVVEKDLSLGTNLLQQ